MKKIGFDNQKYLEMQSGRIRERIAEFGGKLYLEFGCLTTTTPAGYCRAFSRTASCKCCCS